MRTTLRTSGLLLPCVLFTLAGCFSLGRKTPVLEQYVLGGTQVEASAAASSNVPALTIGVRRLDLAAYLATPAIIVRRGGHQIVTSEFHRWGEDPIEGINRAFARYLALGVPVRAVDTAPWPVRSPHDYLVQLHVARFEGTMSAEGSADGEAHVEASWEIIRQADGAVIARGATDHRERGWRVGDYAGLVTLLDRGLGVMARDVGACLANLAAVAPHATGSVEPVAAIGPAVTCAARSE